MALKRKRSSPAFSSSSDSSDYTTKSSPLPFQHSKNHAQLFEKPTWSWPTYDDQPVNQHLNSRTRKRHRDNRPDEQQVYASTINRLYEAQKQHPNAAPVLSQPVEAPRPVQPQKSTLHSFWRIGQGPTHTPMHVDSRDHALANADARCEDCDGSLRHDDAMELDELMIDQESRCQACQRRVCDTCAVLGRDRICLGCASVRWP